MPELTPLQDTVRTHWNIPGLRRDLLNETWNITERHPGWIRIDRTKWLGSADSIWSLAKRTVTPQEWAEAEANGFEQEIVDDYLNALSELLEIEMGESVYGMIEEDKGFLGQYEEGDEEELRLRYTIVDDLGHRLRPRPDRRRSRKHWDPG